MNKYTTYQLILFENDSFRICLDVNSVNIRILKEYYDENGDIYIAEMLFDSSNPSD